jgi:DNA-binding LacI/PurR family transcriptional regulator
MISNSTQRTINGAVVKHRQVANTLRHEIGCGTWAGGVRLPGEQELAQRFQVAHMTLRHAIANLVDEGVLIRVRGKGTYVVDKNENTLPQLTRWPMVLLVPTDAYRLDPYYFPDILEGFQGFMKESGYHAIVQSDDLIRVAPEQGSTIAYLVLEENQARRLDQLRDQGYRVLAINHYTGRRSIPKVRIDDAQGVASAVAHLAAFGHKRLGFIRGPHTNLDAIERLRGFRSAVKEHHICAAHEAGDGFNEAAGYAAARQLLSLPNRPTALVCASDLSALGVIKAAHDLGFSVPRGLSVIGFGDFSVADYMLPALTTIQQARSALGRAAAQSLIDLASGIAIPDTTLPTELIIRSSTSENLVSVKCFL